MTTIATECPVCPKGIKACAHLGDMVVWLAETTDMPRHARNPQQRMKIWGIVGPNKLTQCVCSANHIVNGVDASVTSTDSLADAEAEYERRCALLRAEA